MRQIWLVLAFMPIIWSSCVGVLSFDWEKHHNNDEVKEIMDAVNAECPDITRVYSLPEPAHFGVPDETVNGQKLWVIEFSTNPGTHTEGKPEFKYIGNMHGNEVVGKEILLRLIVFLCDIFKHEDVEIPSTRFLRDDIINLLMNTSIHIMPSMNPDGWDEANDVEDKSSQKAWLTGRANGNGVDLNRNFPDLDKKYYSMLNIPNHHNNHLEALNAMLRNKSLNLQPETKMVMAWIFSVPFVISANMHGGDLVANYPFDEQIKGKFGKIAKTADHELFKELALSYSTAHKKMSVKHKNCDMDGDFTDNKGITNGAAWYSVPRGMQDFNYLASNCFEITLELGCEKFPPGEKLPEFWTDNFDAMINYMFQSHIGIKGQITVPKRYENVPVVIKVYKSEGGKEIPFDHDILSTRYGDYFRLLSSGTYTVKAILRAGNYQDVIATCIDVVNNPKQGAQIVDFDFTSNENRDGTCAQRQRQQELYENFRKYDYDNDAYYILQQMLAKKQNNWY